MIYNSEYAKAYVELNEIIKNLPLKEKNKIPKDFIDFLTENMNQNYNFIFDDKKSLLDQNIKVETKALLVKLYEKYLAKPEEKEFWDKYDKECITIAENEKIQMYNPDDIFNKKQINEEVKEDNLVENYSENLPIEINESIFLKIINFFKNLFHIN